MVRVRVGAEDFFGRREDPEASERVNRTPPPRREARLKSLCRLAGGQEDEYERVDAGDKRQKYVHEKYKLRLDELGVTWRFEQPAP